MQTEGASKVIQTTKQSNTAHPTKSLFPSCLGWDSNSQLRTLDRMLYQLSYMHVYMYVLHMYIQCTCTCIIGIISIILIEYSSCIIIYIRDVGCRVGLSEVGKAHLATAISCLTGRNSHHILVIVGSCVCREMMTQTSTSRYSFPTTYKDTTTSNHLYEYPSVFP